MMISINYGYRNVWSSLLKTLFAGTLLLSPKIHAQCTPPGDLTDGPLNSSTNGVNFSVIYTSDTNSPHYFPTTRARWFRDALPEMHERISDVLNAGDPYSNLLPSYSGYVYDYSDAWASAYANCFVMEADTFGPMGGDAQTPLRKVTGHEMYHTVQRGFLCQITSSCQNDGTSIGGSFAKWVSEGQARFHDDRYHPDFDTATFGTSFESSVADTLGAPEESVFDKSYDAALFWNYLAEQAGYGRIEPHVGVDLVRDWWDAMAAGGTSGAAAAYDTLKDVLAGRGFSLRELFHDYTICNVTRELDVSGAPLSEQVKYRYLDEQPGHGSAYSGTVDKRNHASIASANGSASVVDFAADYYRVPVIFNSECKVVGLQVEADDNAGFALIGSDAGGKVISFSKQVDRNPARTFLVSSNNPIRQLDAVVSGVDGDINYDYTFGEGDVNVDVIRPTNLQPVYPGTHTNAGRFLVRVRVSGPAALMPAGNTNLSVKGLSKEEFTVKVGTNEAAILAADYTGGEYWLSMQAPPQPADGAYPLEVFICQKQTISYGAVVYGSVQLDHVLVVDRSGSMDGEKLDAAKQAAMLYLDAVSDGDGIAVVGFSGNGSECNDDATTFGTNRLYSANWLTRGLFKFGVDGMTAAQLTSIGDGLVKAEQTFATATSRVAAITNQWIVLLSDGQENEELYWGKTNTSCSLPPLRATFPANGIKINAIALGPEADQALMQEMGDMTDGDHTFVDTTDPASPSSRAAGSVQPAGLATSPMGIRLSEAYLRMYEKASGLERIRHGIVNITDPNQSFTFVVPDDDARRGTFYFAWDNPAMTPQISLQSEAGIIKDDGSNIIERTNALHKVYEVNAATVLSPGTYQVEVNSSDAGQLLYGYLADTYKDVQIDLSFTQFRQGNGLGGYQPRGEFEQGVPVQVRATLTDRLGPVQGAVMNVTVVLPDGSIACGPLRLFDDGSHHDREAGDGIYGAEITTTHLAMPRNLPDVDEDKEPLPIPTLSGTYRVLVEASGEANTKDTFTRQTEGAFTVVEASQEQSENDADNDGLPDTWERFYNTNLGLDDASKDPDGDGLINSAEFMLGTDPHDEDSDNGGETDGSEVNNGRCPILPDDDALPVPRGISIFDDPGCESPALMQSKANILVFPDHPSYQFVEIQVATNPSGPFTLVNLVDTSSDLVLNYAHTGLTSGVPYFYRLRAKGVSGSSTAWSRIIKGTPYDDPVPPRGAISINNYASTTATENVWIDLIAYGDAKYIRLGNQPIDGTELLVTINSNRVEHTLDVPPVQPGKAFVYAVFYSAEELAGQMVRAEIMVNTNLPSGGSVDSDEDGLTDNEEIEVYRTDPFNADTDFDGIQDGAETNSSPLADDTDGDGLSDGEEILKGSEPAIRDTAGDGVDDGWKVLYEFDPSVPLSGDTDKDGLSDYDEWLTGTNPTNAASRFASVMAGQDGPNLRVQFPTLRGRLYDVQTSTNIVSALSWQTLTTITAQTYSAEVTLPAPENGAPLNYRLRFRPSGP